MTSGFDQLSAQLAAAQRRRATASPVRARGAVLPLATTAIVVAVIAVVLVTGTAGRHHAPPTHAAGAPTSPGSGRALPHGVWRLRCAERVGTQGPARGMRVFFGEIALPASPGERHALQTSRAGSGWLFAKWGLWVRGGAHVQLIVPTPLRHRLTMAWGTANVNDRGVRMIDPGCTAGHARWLNFVGGYWVRRPMCATLIVARADGRGRKVRLGIGTPCPGQLPPLEPTFG